MFQQNVKPDLLISTKFKDHVDGENPNQFFRLSNVCYVYPTKKVRNFGFVLPKRNDFTFQQLAHLRNNWGQLFILTLNVAFKDIYLTYMIKYN